MTRRCPIVPRRRGTNIDFDVQVGTSLRPATFDQILSILDDAVDRDALDDGVPLGVAELATHSDHLEGVHVYPEYREDDTHA